MKLDRICLLWTYHGSWFYYIHQPCFPWRKTCSLSGSASSALLQQALDWPPMKNHAKPTPAAFWCSCPQRRLHRHWGSLQGKEIILFHEDEYYNIDFSQIWLQFASSQPWFCGVPGLSRRICRAMQDFQLLGVQTDSTTFHSAECGTLATTFQRPLQWANSHQ